MGLKNTYIEKVCRTILKHNFLGTFPYDLFPSYIKSMDYPISFVINLSKSTEPGSHFVCIYMSQNKLEYFDSYGLMPFLPRITNFITRYSINRKYVYNSQMIQSMESYFCGYFVIGYLLSKDLHFDMDLFCKMFSDNLRENDVLIQHFISTVLEMY